MHEAAETLALRASRSENLGVLPEVAIKVMQLSQSASTPVNELAAWVERDAAIAGKVLKVANSAMYGASGSITSISRAVNMLGVTTLRSIVVSVAYQQVTKHTPSAPLFDLRQLWAHSFATAVAARKIAEMGALDMREQMYLAGLLHDIGILMLDRMAPGALNKIIETARKHNITLSAVERQVLGFDHAELGGIVAKNWGFAPCMVEAIRYHHDPEAASECPLPACIVTVANDVALQAGLLNQTAAGPPNRFAREKLGIGEEQVNAITESIVTELGQAQLLLGISM